MAYDSTAPRPPSDLVDFIRSESFPCVGAKSALALDQLVCFEAGDIACPAHDRQIHAAIADFGQGLNPDSPALTSLAVLFEPGAPLTEQAFEKALWRRLQALHDIDAKRGIPWAGNVSSDPHAREFGMSVAGVPYFIVGLHPGASRAARRFHRPALIFNSHDQFERMRSDGRYATMQSIIRKREVEQSGAINPMLAEFGEASEATQYAGRRVDPDWVCPFKVRQ